jgi:hypothetical protein
MGMIIQGLLAGLVQVVSWPTILFVLLGTSIGMVFGALPGLGGFAPGWLSGIDLVGGITGEYLDTHFVDRTFDPRTRHPSFFRFDGSLGFGNLGQGWDFRVTAENLTNEATVVQRREVTLSAGSVPGEGDFVQILEPQRLIYGSFRWTF